MAALGLANLPLYVFAVLLLNITPGPDTAYIVGRSISQGRAAGLVSSLGISTGGCVHVLATALGLTALLTASTTAFTVVKAIGALYLGYLGVRMLMTAPERLDLAASGASASAQRRPLRALFTQGFLTNVLNPKVVMFFLSFLPQFVDPHTEHKTAALLVLGAIFVAMSTMWNSSVAWVAASVTRRIAANSSVKHWLDRFVGIAFIGLAARLALVPR